MITPNISITEVRRLINVEEITTLVDRIYLDEASIKDLDTIMANKKKFIAINCLEQGFEQMQTGTVNVNIYVPDLIDGSRDLETMDNILLAIKPLLEDAATDILATSLGRTRILREDGKQYSFYNQRVNVFSPNLNQNQNIKLN